MARVLGGLFAVLVVALAWVVMTAPNRSPATAAPQAGRTSTPDVAATDTAARVQAAAVSATIQALPPVGAPSPTPTITGRAALSTVVAAATEVTRLRALITPTPEVHLPSTVPPTDTVPAYSIQSWHKSTDPRRVRYNVTTIIRNARGLGSSPSRDDILAVLTSATELAFASMPDAKGVEVTVTTEKDWNMQMGWDARGDTTTDGLDFPGTAPQDGKIHAEYYDQSRGYEDLVLDL